MASPQVSLQDFDNFLHSLLHKQAAGYGGVVPYGAGNLWSQDGEIPLKEVPLYDFDRRVFRQHVRSCLEKEFVCRQVTQLALHRLKAAILAIVEYQKALEIKYGQAVTPQQRAIIKAKYNILELHLRLKLLKKLKKKAMLKLQNACIIELGNFLGQLQ